MPLQVTNGSLAELPSQLPSDGYVVFYSSIVDGQLWCPDCRKVESLVKDTFSTPDAPPAVIVYVGDKPAWKTLSNVFRGEPWNLTSIPTIVKLINVRTILCQD
ncbi:duf953 domain protein [Moniliophthora roreri MCA 2997]|uniref:Duf953 domain protein n=1 Tax=Moniliophthora roreri (strain MCA 2997) TaxID=1381753 RepID=V2X0P1_MONRO|nr:duf953 domain protein [Moniliophthora roreri MCA 2997]